MRRSMVRTEEEGKAEHDGWWLWWGEDGSYGLSKKLNKRKQDEDGKNQPERKKSKGLNLWTPYALWNKARRRWGEETRMERRGGD